MPAPSSVKSMDWNEYLSVNSLWTFFRRITELNIRYAIGIILTWRLSLVFAKSSENKWGELFSMWYYARKFPLFYCETDHYSVLIFSVYWLRCYSYEKALLCSKRSVNIHGSYPPTNQKLILANRRSFAHFLPTVLQSDVFYLMFK